MPKNIIVLSDGTGQKGGQGDNTNIYKLFNMLLKQPPEQVVFYDEGIGTGTRKFISLLTGLGFSKNIQDGYRFIIDNYEEGDQIYLFGFSRGAATVRSLSSFMHYFGVLPKSSPELIPKAYKLYKTKDKDERKSKASAFKKKYQSVPVKIVFLGCYDTVAALGLPVPVLCELIDKIPAFRHKFHDFLLSECVENAYQALAIDDERKEFHPILWDTEMKDYQSIKQVWFCGMHTDVGGGYPEQELSDIPLDWMVQQAEAHGLKINSDYNVKINEDINGTMHNSRGTFFSKLYKKEQRSWDNKRTDSPIIHDSVLKRKKSVNNTDEPVYKAWVAGIEHTVEPWVK
ncbi:MAG: DUF2235 domain-containing protein [Gammaproteobacteria bacterium]|nr:DUF2235 domain-containing protein [Gammaproteobacteria bacterium]